MKGVATAKTRLEAVVRNAPSRLRWLWSIGLLLVFGTLLLLRRLRWLLVFGTLLLLRRLSLFLVLSAFRLFCRPGRLLVLSRLVLWWLLRFLLVFWLFLLLTVFLRVDWCEGSREQEQNCCT